MAREANSRRKILEATQRVAEVEHLLRTRDKRILALERELDAERVARISAQNGLVRYMREHGEGHRIGYDPATDESLTPELLALARMQQVAVA